MFGPENHTFVICAYGQNEHLETTIASLEQQTLSSTILLSTSTPSAFLEGMCERHGIEMLVNPEHKGAGADWNYALAHAGHPLVTLAHQDDIYDPPFLETVLASMNTYSSKDVQIAFTDYYEVRRDAHVDSNILLRVKRALNAPLSHRLINGSPAVKRRLLGFGCAICCPTVTYNRSCVGDGIFDTEYINSCDYKTFVDLAGTRGNFVYIPQRLVGHRIYAESATSRNLGAHIRKREDEEILSMLWPRPVAYMINAMYALSEKNNEL